MTQAVIEDTEVSAGNIVADVEATSPNEAVEAAGAEAVEAAPEQVVTPTPDPREWLATAPEEELVNHERVRDLLRKTEKSAADRAITQARRESASNENTQQVITNLLARAVELGDESEIRRLAPELIEWNGKAQLHQIAQKFPEALMGQYKLPPDVVAKAIDAYGVNPSIPNWDGYVSTLIDGAVEMKVAEARREDEARVKKAIADGVAAELRARQVEAGPRLETPPVAPQGTVSSGGAIATMTDADRAFNEDRISFSDYKKYREQFGLAATPGGR